MKKHNTIKTLQLILFLAITAFGLYRIFTNRELHHLIGVNPSVRLMMFLLWIVLGLSYFFIFLDFCFFSSYKKDYRELDYAVHSDPVAGIANRYSCDALIEKYLDRPLPPSFGCVMFDITNIQEINSLYGHLKGNMLIRDFSNILKLASVELCFVGRNGGNKFLAIFEKTTSDQIYTFIQRVDQRVDAYNSIADKIPIRYQYGIAFQEEGSLSITQLIALANERIYHPLQDMIS